MADPFKYEEPLQPGIDEAILVKREAQLNEVITGIRQSKFWAIYGPQKMGKTTFLSQVQHELCGAFLCIRINFADFPKGKRTCYTWLMEKILLDNQEEFLADSNLKIPTGSDPGDNFFQFLRILPSLRRNSGKEIILLLDDIERVEQIESFLEIIRMVHEGRKSDNILENYLSVVITGCMNLLKLSGGQTSPFNIAGQLYLTDFSREETFQFIERTPIKFEENAKEKLFDDLSGHPQMTQHAMHILTRKAQEESKSITGEDVELAVEEIFRENTSLKILKRQVRNDESLQDIIIDILQGQKIPFFAVEEYAIKGAGPIKEDGYRNCAIRNSVFKKYLAGLRLSKSLYLDTVEDLMRSTVTAENFEDLSQKIVDKCSDLLCTEVVSLWRRVRENGQEKLILAAGKGFSLPLGEKNPSYILDWNAQREKEIEGITAWIAVRKECIHVNNYADLKKHPSYKGALDDVLWNGEPETKFKSLIGVPLFVNDKIAGVLKWENSENPEGFSVEDFEMAKKLSSFIAIALEAMNFREKATQDRQESLRKLTESLLITKDQKNLNKQIVVTTAKLLNADFCSLWLCDNDKKNLNLAAESGQQSEEAETSRYRLNWDAKEDIEIDSITAWVAIQKKAFYARNFEEMEKHKSWEKKWNRAQWGDNPKETFSSFYAVPLVIEDKIFGILKIKRKQPKPPFSTVDRAVFDLMANFIVLGLELSFRLRQEVIFDFFHILKQPTSSAVMAFSDLRRELERPEGQRPERIKKRMEQLSRNLESIRGWSNNVYYLARARVTQLNEKEEFAPLQEQVEAVRKELTLSFNNFTCDISPGIDTFSLLLTNLEKRKLHVILYQIILNSIKYSGDKPEIEIKATVAENQELALRIKDHGQGIPADDLPFIFNPLFTTGAKKWPESMGYGLATVDRLLKEFGFEKKVESEVNKGTEFTIFIPAARWRQNESRKSQ